MPDTALTEPRNISIDLKQRVARFLKMELVFSNVWISISEITFSSNLAEGSFKKESILSINTIESTTKKNVWKQLTYSTTDGQLFGKLNSNNKRKQGKSFRKGAF